MKRLVVMVAVFALAGGAWAFACDKDKAADVQAASTVTDGKEVVLTGYLTDSYCGAKNAHASGKACAIKCMKNGAKLQLLVDQTLYTLEKVDSPESKLGAKVTVTGLLDESTKTILVQSIEKAKKA